MQLRFDEDLVEAAVFLCASGKRRGIPPVQVQRFHRERERVYSILDADERNAAFFKLHLEWFREWGLEELLAKQARAFRLVQDGLTALVFRKARQKGDEGAELYVNPDGGRYGVVALRAERLADAGGLDQFLVPELMHLSDMLDPAFGYSRDESFTGIRISQQRLVRERYRLLWTITIDGRLARAGMTAGATREQRQGEFDQAFDFLPQHQRGLIFRELWEEAAPKHGWLMGLAADPAGLQAARQPSPGAPCPLCGFSTFDWADAARFTDAQQLRVQREFPGWEPGLGLCRRCFEIYQALPG